MKIFIVSIFAGAFLISSAIIPWLRRPEASPAAQSAKTADVEGNDALQRQIVAKEREGLDALKAGDIELFGKLTADDAVLIDAHGLASKAQVLQNVAGFKLTDYSMDDIKFVPLSAKSGLIAYTISEQGISHGKEFAARAYVSSLWEERGSMWVCVFSQETGAR